MQPDASIDLRVARVEVLADGCDAVVLDEDVAAEDVADVGIHAQDVAAAEQNSLRHGHLPSVQFVECDCTAAVLLPPSPVRCNSAMRQ